MPLSTLPSTDRLPARTDLPPHVADGVEPSPAPRCPEPAPLTRQEIRRIVLDVLG